MTLSDHQSLSLSEIFSKQFSFLGKNRHLHKMSICIQMILECGLQQRLKQNSLSKRAYRKVSNRTALPIEPPPPHFKSQIWAYMDLKTIEPPSITAWPPDGSIGDFTVPAIVWNFNFLADWQPANVKLASWKVYPYIFPKSLWMIHSLKKVEPLALGPPYLAQR